MSDSGGDDSKAVVLAGSIKPESSNGAGGGGAGRGRSMPNFSQIHRAAAAATMQAQRRAAQHAVAMANAQHSMMVHAAAIGAAAAAAAAATGVPLMNPHGRMPRGAARRAEMQAAAATAAHMRAAQQAGLPRVPIGAVPVGPVPVPLVPVAFPVAIPVAGIPVAPGGVHIGPGGMPASVGLPMQPGRMPMMPGSVVRTSHRVTTVIRKEPIPESEGKEAKVSMTSMTTEQVTRTPSYHLSKSMPDNQVMGEPIIASDANNPEESSTEAISETHCDKAKASSSNATQSDYFCNKKSEANSSTSTSEDDRKVYRSMSEERDYDPSSEYTDQRSAYKKSSSPQRERARSRSPIHKSAPPIERRPHGQRPYNEPRPAGPPGARDMEQNVPGTMHHRERLHYQKATEDNDSENDMFDDSGRGDYSITARGGKREYSEIRDEMGPRQDFEPNNDTYDSNEGRYDSDNDQYDTRNRNYESNRGGYDSGPIGDGRYTNAYDRGSDSEFGSRSAVARGRGAPGRGGAVSRGSKGHYGMTGTSRGHMAEHDNNDKYRDNHGSQRKYDDYRYQSRGDYDDSNGEWVGPENYDEHSHSHASNNTNVGNEYRDSLHEGEYWAGPSEDENQSSWNEERHKNRQRGQYYEEPGYSGEGDRWEGGPSDDRYSNRSEGSHRHSQPEPGTRGPYDRSDRGHGSIPYRSQSQRHERQDEYGTDEWHHQQPQQHNRPPAGLFLVVNGFY